MNYCFDMDGTIADLYGVDNWLTKIESHDVSPYVEAKPMVDMQKLSECLQELINNGNKVSIISWTSRTGTPDYNKQVRKAKVEWLKKYNIPYTDCHIVKYGTPKSKFFKYDMNILFDDSGKKVVGATHKPYIVHDEVTLAKQFPLIVK